MEEFKQIPESNYQINKLGEVRRKYKNGNISNLNPFLGKNGYYSVTLEKRKRKSIHRLLCEVFIDNPDNLPCVDHINRNRLDNRLENLRWVSYRDNSLNKTQKGSISKTHDKIKDKIYIGYRATYYENQKRKSKRFKLKEDAENWLNENLTKVEIYSNN